MTPDGGGPKAVGFARPEQPLELVCKDFMGTATPTLHLCLQPNQMAALEALRAAGDLTFDLAFVGTGADEHGDQYLHGQCSVRVPRSEWLQTLRGAGARNVMLFEVALPLEGEVCDLWREVVSNLRSAEADFGGGNYRGCIASCRAVFDELAGLRDLELPLAFKRLGEGRSGDMTKPQREEAVYAALRHYTHLAHHAAGDGGETSFTRGEAQFMLSATAAAVRLVQMG